MAYLEGKAVHRYLGQGKACVEVMVTKIYPDSRCMLADGSVINRFTKSYYHDAESCPVPRLSVIDKTGTVRVQFPTVVETRRYRSKTKPNQEPYTTEKLSNGKYTCNCPGATYHGGFCKAHIGAWMAEDGLPVPD